MKKTKDIRISLPEATTERTDKEIAIAKKEGYELLTFTHEPLVGPWVAIDLNEV